MKNKTILITAGPTREYIDPVRFISNASSGKMGYLLAKEADRRGYKTIVITGPVELERPESVEFVDAVSAQDMLDAVKRKITSCDVFISCAAVSDYRPASRSNSKIKKTGGSLTIKLVPNPDILLEAGKMKFRRCRRPMLVGFALETESLIENARSKMEKKKLDMIVANYASSIGADVSSGALITKQGIEKFGNVSKTRLAAMIFDTVEQLSQTRKSKV
jgi:phosphopantothenoylcysteine decarboxylase/phosphopantothenate--cysteine ligase